MKESKTSPVLLGILVVVVFAFVCYLLRNILRPFFVAMFLAVLFEPVMSGFRRLKFPKPLAVILVLIIAFTTLILLGISVYAGASSFSTEYPKYEGKIVALFHSALNLFNIPVEDLNNYIKEIDWAKAIQDLSLPSFVSSSLGSIFSFLGNVFLVLIFMFYALLGKEYLIVRIRRAFPDKKSNEIMTAITNINSQIQRYLVTKTLISFITGVLVTCILLLFDVDLAIVFGLLTFLLNFIPNVGSIIAIIPPILLSFLQFDSLLYPLWIGISLIVVQMLMGNILEPKLMGKSLDLSPLVVILFLIFWGFLWGIVGMVLAVPIAASIKIVTGNVKGWKPISILMSGIKE